MVVVVVVVVVVVLVVEVEVVHAFFSNVPTYSAILSLHQFEIKCVRFYGLCGLLIAPLPPYVSVYSLTAACSSWQRVTHLHLDWQQPWQATPLVKWSCLKSLLKTSLLAAKRTPITCAMRSLWAPTLANLSASLFVTILWCPGIHTKVTLLGPLSFYSTCIHSQNKVDSAVDFASAAVITMLSEKLHTVLNIIFLDKSCSTHLRMGITSAENTVEVLPVVKFSYRY